MRNVDFELEIYLHDKLTRIGACHCRALTSCQNANGPNEQCCLAILAAKENASPVDIHVDSIIVVWKRPFRQGTIKAREQLKQNVLRSTKKSSRRIQIGAFLV